MTLEAVLPLASYQTPQGRPLLLGGFGPRQLLTQFILSRFYSPDVPVLLSAYDLCEKKKKHPKTLRCLRVCVCVFVCECVDAHLASVHERTMTCVVP
jgi:hypothetical protein